MDFSQFLKNPAFAKASTGKKKFYIILSIVLISGLFFLSSAFSVLACEKNQDNFSSYFNPLISFAEKTVKGFGFNVSLAATPDPDFCGSDSVGCSGFSPTATVNWTAAPGRVSYESGNREHSYNFSYYRLTVGGNTHQTTNTSHSVSSGLNNNTSYNWSVEAYYQASRSSASLGVTNRPHGSFTTLNCAPPPSPPTASISADSTSIPYNTATTIRWSSTNATSCTVSPPGWTGTSGARGTGNLTSSQTYTVNCTGPGGSVTESVTVNVGAPPPGNFSLSLSGGGGSVTCNSVPLTWTSSSGADGYRILRGAPRVDISPYQPYTALNFIDTSVSQNTTYPYQIEAYNAGGTNRSNTLNVSTPYCPPTVDLSAAPMSIYQGQSTTLSWTTTRTTSCTASGGWSGSKAINGNEVVIPSPPPSVIYNLQCSGPGGSALGSTIIDITSLFLPDWREIIPR